MYERFYNLTEEPFRLSPSARFCYRHSTYRKAFAYMQYALHRGEGFVVVTGQPGTGKTTLIAELTSTLSEQETVFSNLSSTRLEGDDLLRMVCFGFGLDGDQPHKAGLLHQLERFFHHTFEQGRRPLLIIDEAQRLTHGALEELRLMTNLQRDGQPLLQIFLVGQEELRDLVRSPELEQLHQRIVASCHLEPLSAEDTEHFIRHRLERAGWRDDPRFAPEIYPLIHRFSLGIPRWINLICSRLMLHGMVEERHAFDLHDLADVLQGLLDEHLLPNQVAEQEWSEALEAMRTSPRTATSEQAEPASETNAPEESDSPPNAAAPPEAGESAKESHEAPTHDALAALLYTQLQPRLIDRPEREYLGCFLDFLDGREIGGTRLRLATGEARSRFEALGPAAWLRETHPGLDTREMSEELLELMGLVTWLRRSQPDLDSGTLETVGLLYRFMRADSPR